MTTVATQNRAERGTQAKPLAFSFGFLSLQPLAALVDVAVLAVAGVLSQFLYDTPYPSASEMLGVVVIATTIFVSLSYLTGSYAQSSAASPRRAALAALRLWAITMCFLAIGAFLLKIGAHFSRGSVLIFAVLGAVLLAGKYVAWPVAVRSAVERGLIFVTNVMVLRVTGDRSSETSGEASEVVELRHNGLRPVAMHSVPFGGSDEQWQRALDLVGEQLRLGQIDEIIVLADGVSIGAMEEVVERLRMFPLPVRLVLDQCARRLLDRNLTNLGGCVLAEYQRAPLSVSERFLKRALDVLLATSGLLFLSPMLVMIALVIRLDTPGPVLFLQSRRGFGGRPFTIFKFRSMMVADDGDVVVQAKRGDARVTRVGRWIRRTSIDELPQLLNVLRGDMSIVGPRPHAVAHDDYYSRFIEEYAFRHHAKPGLTGWAQVKGLRGETPHIENMKARIEKDIWYIDHWSIWLDLNIIARTIVAVLGHKAAY